MRRYRRNYGYSGFSGYRRGNIIGDIIKFILVALFFMVIFYYLSPYLMPILMHYLPANPSKLQGLPHFHITIDN